MTNECLISEYLVAKNLLPMCKSVLPWITNNFFFTSCVGTYTSQKTVLRFFPNAIFHLSLSPFPFTMSLHIIQIQSSLLSPSSQASMLLTIYLETNGSSVQGMKWKHVLWAFLRADSIFDIPIYIKYCLKKKKIIKSTVSFSRNFHVNLLIGICWFYYAGTSKLSWIIWH